MTHREKFSEKSFRALSSQNRAREGIGSEEEVDAPDEKGSRTEWICIWVLKSGLTQERERWREGQSKKHQQDNI